MCCDSPLDEPMGASDCTVDQAVLESLELIFDSVAQVDDGFVLRTVAGRQYRIVEQSVNNLVPPFKEEIVAVVQLTPHGEAVYRSATVLKPSEPWSLISMLRYCVDVPVAAHAPSSKSAISHHLVRWRRLIQHERLQPVSPWKKRRRNKGGAAGVGRDAEFGARIACHFSFWVTCGSRVVISLIWCSDVIVILWCHVVQKKARRRKGQSSTPFCGDRRFVTGIPGSHRSVLQA